MTVRHIPWHPSPHGGALGRSVEHDPASRQYAVVRQATPIASRHWTRHVPIYNQGNLGSCTGNAMAGCLSTGPFRHTFGEYTARRVYSAATAIDEFPGQWPPTDTGSSGLAVCKVAQRRGWISSYQHAFTLDDVQVALQDGPAICGIEWFDSFDRPGPGGLCTITPNATVRGGHEVCLVGLDVAARTVRFANSWSDQWGAKGFGTWSYDTLDTLLHRDGDVTVPVA